MTDGYHSRIFINKNSNVDRPAQFSIGMLVIIWGLHNYTPDGILAVLTERYYIKCDKIAFVRYELKMTNRCYIGEDMQYTDDIAIYAKHLLRYFFIACAALNCLTLAYNNYDFSLTVCFLAITCGKYSEWKLQAPNRTIVSIIQLIRGKLRSGSFDTALIRLEENYEESKKRAVKYKCKGKRANLCRLNIDITILHLSR